MIFKDTGHIADGFYVTGFPWSPAYLLDSSTPLIFEAGFYCMGPHYERDIKKILDGRPPRFLFLTHVHYDHCGSAAYLKKVFPGMKVCASKRAGEIIARPNAIKLMTSLSRDSIPLIASTEGVDENLLLRSPFEPFDIDIIFDDEQTFMADPSLSILIMVTPGHTRDMLSFYIPSHKVLIATESVGCRGQTGQIVSEFLVDFDAYITSLKRLASLDVEILCQGHHFVYTGSNVKDFFDASLNAAHNFKDHVLELLAAENNCVENVVRRIKEEEYDPNPGPKQPEGAYLLNLKTRIAHLAGRS